jgi:PAS domain S-box-containing protein
MTFSWRTAKALSPAAGVAASFLALAAAIALRSALDPVLADSVPFITLFGAVAAAIWLSGLKAAVAVSLVGYVAAAYLFIPPRGAVGFGTVENLVGLLVYLFTCALIIAFGEAMRVAQARESTSRELLRVTLASIGDAVITTDVDGKIAYLNAVAEALTGWRQAEAAGRPLDTVFRIVNETTRKPVESPATRALREGVVVGLANHTVLIRQDGSECPIDDSAAPIRDERGRVSGCVLIFRDVTAQRRSERERYEQLLTARRLASIVESSEAAIVGKNLDGIIDSWNAAAERLFGYKAEEAIGRHISLVIPPERLAEEDRIIATLKAGQRVEQFETERVRADGRRVLVSLTISPIKDDDGNVVGASNVGRDITREREAEADRRRLVALIETSTDFIGICDLAGVPMFVNQAGLDMVGLDGIEAARRVSVWDFFFPEDQARIRDELFPVVIAQGHGELEVRFRHFKTGAARWMAYKVLALTDDAGQPIAIGTVSQDVTHRKELEDDLRKLAAELSAADKRKDEFLATLAHELRGPLAPLTNVLALWKRSSDVEQLKRARDTMERQLGQMVRLVDDLLEVNRITHDRLELRKERVELSQIVDHAVEANRPMIEARGHELTVKLPAEPCYLYADAARLGQVFANLLNNACKYTEPGGKISLRADRHGSDVVVSVRDTGIGIPADKLDRVFDMFAQIDSTVGHAQGGLGIGLTLVKRLVGMHDGSVEARSAGVGSGSEFIVRLPIDRREPHAQATAPIAETRPAHGRRILVVDDNTDSALSLAMLLEVAGHETVTAHDGPSALDAAERHRPDIVLLDIGLPGLNGHEVCRRLRAKPWGRNVLVIALTGWGQDEDRRMSQDAGFDGHLVKPVDYERLAALLTSVEREQSAAS